MTTYCLVPVIKQSDYGKFQRGIVKELITVMKVGSERLQVQEIIKYLRHAQMTKV